MIGSRQRYKLALLFQQRRRARAALRDPTEGLPIEFPFFLHGGPVGLAQETDQALRPGA